jgi:hypothetical protein
MFASRNRAAAWLFMRGHSGSSSCSSRKESSTTEIGFNRTAATAPLFNYLAPSECADEKSGEPHFRELEPA